MAKRTSGEQSSKTEQEKKERTSLYLTQAMQQKIKYICLKDKVFQNDVVEKALDGYINNWEKKNGEIKL